MNERIKSLIERAEYQARKYPGSDWEVYVEPSREQIFEKFAELIVRECMNAVCDPSTTYLESMTDASAMYTARERIRKHFRS